jgi:hypothetical protein
MYQLIWIASRADTPEQAQEYALAFADALVERTAVGQWALQR